MEKMAMPCEWAAKRKIFHQSGLKMCVHIYMYVCVYRCIYMSMSVCVWAGVIWDWAEAGEWEEN